jgi:NADP-dependent 3-hydroxy acid dehydrogenase YdfG
MTDVNVQGTSTDTNTQTKPINPPRPFAMITGASTRIGYELAKCCDEKGFDLLIAADEPNIC